MGPYLGCPHGQPPVPGKVGAVAQSDMETLSQHASGAGDSSASTLSFLSQKEPAQRAAPESLANPGPFPLRT